jgi:hypothetical protein
MDFILPRRAENIGLTLCQPERGPSGELDYFTCHISGPSLDASARVYAYRCHGLVELFEGMARDWRGWTRAKEWESLEGELRLACSTDGLGHVRIIVSLRPSLYPDEWQVSGIGLVDAGQLDDLASAARRFVNGKEGAA